MFKNIYKVSKIIPQICSRNAQLPFLTCFRNYVAAPKRFYKKPNILQSNGRFEITLDSKKLKTPNGQVFIIESEPLAMAVASEWDAQKDIIDRSSMHLTALCNTVLDNPNHLEKPDMINYLLNMISTDTVLFHSMEEKLLGELQTKEWDPLIEWFNKEFDTDVSKTTGLSVPSVSPQTKMNLGKYFGSYNLASLHGFTYAIDTLKSLILACAVVKMHLSVEKAVLLSRLEEEYQLGHWGRVEWAHDLNQQELQARLSAAVLFIYCNSSSQLIKQKLN